MKIFKSLRFQIIGFLVLVTILSGVVISATGYYESRKLLNERLNSEVANSADMISQNFQQNLDDSRKTALQLAKNPAFIDFNRKKIDEISDYFIRFTDIFFNIYVFDTRGRLITARYYDERNYKVRGESLHDYRNVFTDYAYRVFSDGKPRFTDTFKTDSGRLLISFIAPIKARTGKEVNGIISCGIYVFNPKLQSLLKSLTPAYDGFICLVDKEGNVLGSAGSFPRDKADLKEVLEDNKKPGGEFLPIVEVNNVFYRYVKRPINPGRLYVVVGMPDDVEKKLLAAHVKEMLLYNGISILLVIIFSVLISDFLVSPVSRLVEGLKKVGDGNYKATIEVKTYGEMKEAVDAFNNMTDKLQKKKIIEKVWNRNWKGGDVE